MRVFCLPGHHFAKEETTRPAMQLIGWERIPLARTWNGVWMRHPGSPASFLVCPEHAKELPDAGKG